MNILKSKATHHRLGQGRPQVEQRRSGCRGTEDTEVSIDLLRLRRSKPIKDFLCVLCASVVKSS